MRIAALTFVRKEEDWFPIWLKYYCKEVDELFVINPNQEKYPKEPKWTEIKTDGDGGNSLPWGQEQVNNAIKDLLQRFDWVIYSDADEYIIPKYSDIRGFLQHKHHEAMFTCKGYDLLDEQEAPLDLTKPIFRQRRYWVYSHAYCKTVITKVPIILAEGCHYTEEMYTESGLRNVSVRQVVEESITRDLYLIHMRRCDKTLYDKKPDRGNYWSVERDLKKRLPNWIKDRL